MSSLRFSTVQQIIDAYPVLKDDFKSGDLQSHPIRFVDHLSTTKQLKEAFALCAFMLPRRDAVRWLCESLRSHGEYFSEKDQRLLGLAEAWVQNPTEKTRATALAAAMESGFQTGPAWAAAAAGWTGGSLSPDPAKPVPPPPFMTGQAVKAGFVVGYWNHFGEKRDERGNAAIKHALKILQPPS